MANTIENPPPLNVNGVTNPAAIQQRRVTAELNGNQLTSSGVESEGNSKIFDKASKALGKQDFLNLLVTQLKFQDPLEPTENTEFVAQLAQFSNLEGTQNINTAIEDLGKKMESLVENQATSAATISNASATSLIGKSVRVNAKDVLFDPSRTEPLEINVHVNPGTSSVLSIVDSEGAIVNAMPLEFTGEGMVKWSGQKMDGGLAPRGVYELKVTSLDGSKDTGYTFLDDRVTGISFAKSGMRLDVKGQSVGLDQVLHVAEYSEKEPE